MNVICNNGFDPNQSCSPPLRLRRRLKARRGRSERGGQITELPPALILLLIVIFFPMLDILYYGFAFGAAWYLHQLEARAVSVSAPQPPNGPGSSFDGHQIAELSQKETEFINGGLGCFLGLQDLNCQVQYLADPNNPAVVGSSTLNNTFRVKAMISLPIPYFDPATIPALNGINGGFIDFKYSSNVLQEERGLN